LEQRATLGSCMTSSRVQTLTKLCSQDWHAWLQRNRCMVPRDNMDIDFHVRHRSPAHRGIELTTTRLKTRAKYREFSRVRARTIAPIGCLTLLIRSLNILQNG
jgi:hypothetical protein